ncbi:MAG: alanine racemase [Elusimicrobiota bacterium]
MPLPYLSKWIEVDLNRLIANTQAVRRSLGPKVKLMGMVKSNAYGHGLERTAKTLASHPACDALGVWTLQEAARVWRSCGRAKPQVALMAPAFDPPPALARAVREGAWLTLDRPELETSTARAALIARTSAQIFLDLDLGLGRWGCSVKNALALTRRLMRQKSLRLVGVSSHIDYLPGLHKTEAEIKLNRFFETAVAIESLIGRPLIKTCANSSVFLDFPAWRLDMVRIGNLLYGVNPTATAFAVKNIWSFKARILSLKRLRSGETVGYGSEFLALNNMTAASVGCGFADGLSMEPAHRFIRLSGPNPYRAKFKGRELPIVGRVGLGHALLDASKTPEIRVGDIVDLPVRRTAAALDVPRIYI